MLTRDEFRNKMSKTKGIIVQVFWDGISQVGVTTGNQSVRLMSGCETPGMPAIRLY